MGRRLRQSLDGGTSKVKALEVKTSVAAPPISLRGNEVSFGTQPSLLRSLSD